MRKHVETQREKVIISIDFDFFVREDLLWDFGHREEPLFIDQVWNLARYPYIDLYEETDMITHADCLPIAFPYELSKRGFHFSRKTRIGVGWSHKFAYNFFRNAQSKTLFHFDAHHDCYTESGDANGITCGNWLIKLQDVKPLETIIWVIPKWADNGYTEAKASMNDRRAKDLKKLRFPEISNLPREVEAVYLAQSPAWVPPHHDEMFHFLRFSLCNFCKKKYIDVDDQFVQRKAPSKEEAKQMFLEYQEQKTRFSSIREDLRQNIMQGGKDKDDSL
jgi:hypothetical protein